MNERMKLGSVGVQEVRLEQGRTVRAGDYNFFYGRGKDNFQLWNSSAFGGTKLS